MRIEQIEENGKIYEVRVYDNGNKWWHLNGKLHREDGPAVEYADGSKEWYLNGKFHREDGPAVEWADGDKFWYLNGKEHREDGPAVEHADGDKRWYLNGKQLTEEEWKLSKKWNNLKELNMQVGISTCAKCNHQLKEPYPGIKYCPICEA